MSLKRPSKSDLEDLTELAKRLKTLEAKMKRADTFDSGDSKGGADPADSEDSDEWPVEYLYSSDDGDIDDDRDNQSQNQKVKEEVVKIEDETVNIPDEIRILLGDITERTPLGKTIIPELASKVERVLKDGLKKEERETICSRNSVPENCQFLGGPKLNAEIAATLNYRQATEDKKIASRQDKVGTALTAILQVTDNLIKQGDKENVIPLIDAINTLADTQHYDTKMRKRTIVPLLDKKLLNFLDESSKNLDGYLFGKDLGNKIKQFKTVGRQGVNIKAKNFMTNRYPQNTGPRSKIEGKQYQPSGANNQNSYRKTNQSKNFRGKFNVNRTQPQPRTNLPQRIATEKK